MKKYIFALTAAAALLTACEVDDVYYGKKVDPDPEAYLATPYKIDWAAAADSTTYVLTHRFMDQTRCTFWNTEEDRLQNSGNSYWPQAHAMDVVVDAYLRVKDTDSERKAEYERYMANWHRNKANNWAGSGWRGTAGFGNEFTDDSEWIILTLIRMFEATGEQKYLADAITTYKETVISRWTYDENGGGVRWCMTRDNSKNACSNGPAVIIAAKLYRLTQDEQYLADAIKIYNWLSSTLFNAETGAVADNMAGGVINGGALSYNQGTFLGGAHCLYQITGDKKYLRDALLAADYNMSSAMTVDGIMRNEGTGDNALFKGIFIRYATLLANDTAVDAAKRREISNFITYNANTCWTKGINKASDDWSLFFGGLWSELRTDYGGSLNEQISASTLIEAMNVLKR